MDVLFGNAASLSDRLFHELGKYRRDIFIEKLGWELDATNELELDQFDRNDTIYVLARDENRRIIGCARLLPTTRPYLLGEVFPNLLNGLKPPCSKEVWELSRFAATGHLNQGSSPGPQHPSKLAIEILNVAANYAKRQGAKRLITVSPIGMERLLQKTGFHTHRAGPPILVAGHPTVACWIEIDE
ncbi:acyl-homoserine-lactone synthase [Solilutibacter silvestris]|uniref:Acyl-homoserine-lactone synthase n=1 Tax=Solilutibacter silvestris TaxID=1645665 RepID=A0A2K1PZD8_9GAMM|nr:acyl-homoserine-lactone synthase [Lysobacter silvestris]PNS08162.1 N-acyl-L-homoserine lactone synthetase [Lysobacter silvestris]